MTNLTKCEDPAVWEENGKVRRDRTPLISHFSKSYFRRERSGGCAQVRLLVEKGCDSKESGSGEEEESGEELIKDLLMEEFG